EVVEIARRRNILVAVDGAQTAGMFRFNLREMGCDFYAASSHKWMYSPKGIGVFYARQESQHHLKPLIVANGYQNKTIRRLENYNTRNLPELLGLGTAIDFHNLLGPENKEKRIFELKKYFREKIAEKQGYNIKTPEPDDLSAGIITVEVEGHKVVEVGRKLDNEYKINCRPMYSFGLNGLKMGGKFELLPYTSGWIQRDDTIDDENGETGIDLKWNISAKMTADFTYNTDFAQVEADQERVNNSRFSLFFPEKRDFFLEGAETFNFGQGGGGGGLGRARSGNLQIFHSRRIGITEGIPIPIMGGTRLYGKAGGFTYGLMSIQTEDRFEPADEDDEDSEDYDIPETNYSVFRLKKDVFSRSSVGLMVLNKELKGSSDFNRTWGIDSHFPITQTFSFYAVGSGTYSPGENKNNMAGNAGFNYSSDLWQYSLSYLNIEEYFIPEMGYIRRTDIKRTGARIAYSPRPERFESIRKFNYQVTGNYQTDHENKLLDREIQGEFRIEFENTSRFSINVERKFEYIDAAWDVREGHTISEGEYQTTGYRASFSTPRTKALNGSLNINGGNFYNGDQVGGSIRGDLRLFNRFIGGFSYNYTKINLPSGDFHTNTSSLRMTYSFNPDLFVKAYIQWYADTIQNSGKNKFLANFLVRYIYRPGSDFYLVYNQQNLFGPNDHLEADVLSNRTVIAKFTYFFRK
ncbi:aminotransferase class V-fold PLP-dependent enzyme, partial [candidate division KSB1 bacterium]